MVIILKKTSINRLFKKEKPANPWCLQAFCGGGGGIRTHGSFYRITRFRVLFPCWNNMELCGKSTRLAPPKAGWKSLIFKGFRPAFFVFSSSYWHRRYFRKRGIFLHEWQNSAAPLCTPLCNHSITYYWQNHILWRVLWEKNMTSFGNNIPNI